MIAHFAPSISLKVLMIFLASYLIALPCLRNALLSSIPLNLSIFPSIYTLFSIPILYLSLVLFNLPLS